MCNGSGIYAKLTGGFYSTREIWVYSKSKIDNVGRVSRECQKWKEMTQERHPTPDGRKNDMTTI